MKNKRGIVILSLLSIFLLLSGGCVDKKKVNDIEKSQKEILNKIAAIEKNLNQISKKSQRKKPTSNYSSVYDIPIGNSPVRGNKNASVTIVEFSDFQCPYCAKSQPVLEAVLKAYPEDVKLVYKNYPLPFHRQARNAAKAFLAAGEQGKFWEMHDLIFENYNRLSVKKFNEFAEQIGLDVNKFMADYNSNKYDMQIQIDISLGNKVGIRGTPTFFVNGKRMMRRSFADFKEAIDKSLKK